MQLVKISDTVWVNPACVIAVNEAKDGRVWVETIDTGTSDAGKSFRGRAGALVELINGSLEADRCALELRIRRAGEVVVNGLADLGNEIGSAIVDGAVRREGG